VNAPANRIFVPVLWEVGKGLTMPLPDQVHLLHELDADLEALTARLMADGISAEEARRRATEALVPDAETLQALERLHQPLYARVTGRLNEDRLRRLERGSLALATAFVVAGSALALVRADLATTASPFQWPVMAIGYVVFAAMSAKAFEIWIKRDHRAPRRGLSGILVLSGVALLVGTAGALTDFYFLSATLEVTPELTTELVSAWIVRDAVLLATAIVVALGGSLGWLVLDQWLSQIGNQRLEVLGLNPTTLEHKGD